MEDKGMAHLGRRASTPLIWETKKHLEPLVVLERSVIAMSVVVVFLCSERWIWGERSGEACHIFRL